MRAFEPFRKIVVGMIKLTHTSSPSHREKSTEDLYAEEYALLSGFAIQHQKFPYHRNWFEWMRSRFRRMHPIKCSLFSLVELCTFPTIRLVQGTDKRDSRETQRALRRADKENRLCY